ASTDRSAELNFIPASDSRFSYEGRFDTSNPTAGPVVVWQGSRMRLEFEGDSLALRFTDVEGQNFFNATIDGQTTVVDASAPTPITGLGKGRHELVLFKRSEAAAGTARFTGVELAPNANVFAAEPPRYERALLFI